MIICIRAFMVVAVPITFIASPAVRAQAIYSPAITVNTWAGSAGTTLIDGVGSDARFNQPRSAAVDIAGNVYIADAWTHTIRKISSGGVVSTVAGMAGHPGPANGTGTGAQFSSPGAVAVDSAGNVYVADSNNHAIRKIATGGVVTTLAGTIGSPGAVNGTGSVARFYYPSGIAVDSTGNLYVADTGNCIIRKITSAGVVTTLAGTAGFAGSANGTGSAARFSAVTGSDGSIPGNTYVTGGISDVAVDSAGNVYAADAGNSTIRKITSAGVVTTLAGTAGNAGYADGTASGARFNHASGVAVDTSGNVFVADTYNHAIRKISTAGVVTTFAGSDDITLAGQLEREGAVDGTGNLARFSGPQGLAVDGAGNVYVADTNNDLIRRISTARVVTTLAGAFGGTDAADGIGATARFQGPSAMAADRVGNVYIADRFNQTIRKLASNGTVTTLAGSAGVIGSEDGIGRSAASTGPNGVAVDHGGNLYVADTENYTVRKITTAGEVTTFAGLALSPGTTDGSAAVARFSRPIAVAVDGTGIVYVVDKLTVGSALRRITPAGVVTTVPVTGHTLSSIAVDEGGSLYGVAGSSVVKITAESGVTTLAGSAGAPGSLDSSGFAARFGGENNLYNGVEVFGGLCVDGAGNVYVADTANQTVRKITPAGVVTTVAGATGISGALDGAGNVARFSSPTGVAVDDLGRIYIADYGNNTIRSGVLPPDMTSPRAARAALDQAFSYLVSFYGAPSSFTATGLPPGLVLDPTTGAISGRAVILGTFSVALTATGLGGTGSATLILTVEDQTLILTTLAGGIGAPGALDGTGVSAQFASAQNVAIDGTGNLYVADTNNHAIRKISAAGVVTTIAGSPGNPGSTDGVGAAARFKSPGGIAVDNSGIIYVADTLNHTIRTITTDGIVATVAGAAGLSGTVNGNGTLARFSSPVSLTLDHAGNLYVADKSNHVIRKISRTGDVTTFAGVAGARGSIDGVGGAALFDTPSGVAVDATDTLYVADTLNSTVRKITPAGLVSTLAGLADNVGSVDGNNASARFRFPGAVAVDLTGNVYISDTGSFTLRKISTTGVVTTLAGLAGASGNNNGSGNAARFAIPMGLAVDGGGNVIIADAGNSSLRKITTAGLVTTFAGTTGVAGMANGRRDGALFNGPAGMAVDSLGTVYIADTDNHTIRMITRTGMTTTIAGLAGTAGSANGTGSAARFNGPSGIAVDSDGILYVADTLNHTIRMIAPGGVVTTLAGLTGNPGSANGAGSVARFNNPMGLALNSSGNVFVADKSNHLIRRIAGGGNVVTVAGTAGVAGFVDGPTSNARFNSPTGIVVDPFGDVFIVDSANHAIRRIRDTGLVSTWAGLAGSSGSANGTGNTARFNTPTALAWDGFGNILVADTGNQTIRRISNAAVVTTMAGTPALAGSTDGQSSAARFSGPRAIGIRSVTGDVYVADTLNHTIRWGAIALPALTSAPTVKATLGQLLYYQVIFSNAVSSEITVTGLPDALGFTAGSGIIAGFPDVEGTFLITVGATNGAGTGTAVITLIFAKASQTLTFGALANKVYSSAPFTLSASTNSGLPAIFSIVSGPASIAGNALTLLGVGTVVVRASQPGDANTNAAADVDQSFIVTPASQTITFGPLANKVFGDGSFTVSATTSSGLQPVFSIVSGPATISGNIVTPTGVGTVIVRASQPGNVNINTAPDVDQSFSVAKANQTITFGALASKTYGDAAFIITATASSGLAPILSIVSGPATISGGTVTLTGAGTVVIRASQAGNATTNTAVDVDQSFTVAKANQTITFGSLAAKTYGNAAFTVAATASSGLAPSFAIVSGPATISGNTVTLTGAGTVFVRASQSGSSNYNAASPIDQSFAVAKASQTITFGALANKTYGDPPLTINATASSGLAATFSIVSGPATLSGNAVTLTGAGTVVVRASQTGNENFNAASNVDRSFTVAKAAATVSLGNLSATYDGSPKNATAITLPAGLSVTFTYGGNTTAPTNAGTYTVVGTIADINYQGSATASLVTTKRTLTVTADNKSRIVGTANPTLTATYTGFVNGESTGVITGAPALSTTAVLASGIGSYAITVVAGTLAATNYSFAFMAGTLTVDPAPVAPTITIPPQSQAVGSGMSFTLNVGVAGTAPFTYQWRKDGFALTGATNRIFSITSAQTSDAGSYTVVVTNMAGTATSSSATLSVVAAGTGATHGIVGSGYIAGGQMMITNTMTYSGTATAIGWQVLLPTGWTFASDGGVAGSTKPANGQADLLEWSWTTITPSPVTFTYTLNVPAGQIGDKSIAALYILRQSGPAVQILARPDPLVIFQVTTHSADTDHNFRISLLELTRVIELYNTRNGGIRTGCYKVDAPGEDGFNPEPTRAASATATLAFYHTADSDRNGKISLLELTRVIEIYNFRSGGVRTGQYHLQPGNIDCNGLTVTATEDGFAPGPCP